MYEKKLFHITIRDACFQFQFDTAVVENPGIVYTSRPSTNYIQNLQFRSSHHLSVYGESIFRISILFSFTAIRTLNVNMRAIYASNDTRKPLDGLKFHFHRVQIIENIEKVHIEARGR